MGSNNRDPLGAVDFYFLIAFILLTENNFRFFARNKGFVNAHLSLFLTSYSSPSLTLQSKNLLIKPSRKSRGPVSRLRSNRGCSIEKLSALGKLTRVLLINSCSAKTYILISTSTPAGKLRLIKESMVLAVGSSISIKRL